MNRSAYINLLKENIVSVRFNKKDGVVRIMNCTLRNDIIPSEFNNADDSSSQKKARIVNEDVLPVWDVDKKSWRSFRVNSVIDYDVQYQAYVPPGHFNG